MDFSLAGISIQQIIIFLCVAEYEGFAKASDYLHMTQSAVSKSVAKMEKELGIELFQRTTREIHLTDAGKILYHDWNDQVRAMHDSYIRAASLDAEKEAVLHIGLLNTARPERYFWNLEERFKKEYPGIQLIENPYYDTCNNIASLYVARDYIENAIILDGDQIIYNSEILAPEFERSGYNSVWTDGETDEWLQTVENGIVTSCSRTGGKGGWQLYSISRWTAEDGKKLKHHLEIEFEEKKNRQIYWDDVAMFCYPEEYQLGIRPMNKDDIIEVDNLSELIALDVSYKKYVEEK